MFRFKPLSVGLVAAFGSAATLTALPAKAQQTAPQKIERIEVTGSNIKRTDQESTAPIQVITAEEIRQSGKATVTEVLRTLPANATGGLNDLTGSNSFSSGASSISLRGLGSASTLVLLNGRRIAPYGLADPNFGQSSAVNLDAIPLDAVERIDVLKDGASAIYGSEAIAGVVNIILRRDFTGYLAGVTGSTNVKGLYKDASAVATLGFGDLAADKYNVFFNAEVYRRERVGFKDAEDFLNRGEFKNSTRYRTGDPVFSSYSPTGNYYSNVFFDPVTLGSSFYAAPAVAAPGCPAGQFGRGACRYDIWSFIDIVPKSDRANLFARGSIDLSANFSAFAEVGFNRLKTKYSNPPQVYGDFGSWYAAGTNRIVNIPEVLPPNHPNNPTGDYVGFRYRFADVGPGGVDVASDTTRALIGFKAALGSWDVDSGLLFSGNKTEATLLNQIRTSVLTNAILNGTYNFANPSAGSITAKDLRINPKDVGKTSFSIFDLKGTTELGKLAGGPIGLAAGLEYRRETRDSKPDQTRLDGEVLGYGAAASDGKRNATTVFGEVSLPFIKNVELQLALRSDKYSDYGTSTIPKIGASWKPVQELKLRGSYAEGFRAPSLTEITKTSVSAFTTVEDPKRCLTGNEADCSKGIGLLIVANPNVKAETAKTYNLGVVIEPAKDTSISVDLFRITRKNEIDTISFADILNNEDNPDPRYAGRVVRGPTDTPGLPGPIQVIRTGYFNLGKTDVRGVDIDLRNKFNLGESGKLDMRLLTTYYQSWKGSGDETAPMVQQAGYRNTPRFRSSLVNSWEYQSWTSSLIFNYTSGFKSYVNNSGQNDSNVCVNPGSIYLGYCRVGEWLTADVSTEYKGVKNWTLYGSVRNIFNRKPSLDPLSRPANFEWFDARGAYLTAGARYEFK